MRYRISGELEIEPIEDTPDPGGEMVVFRPGVSHVATEANPQLRIEDGITPPPGRYSFAEVQFLFDFAGWNPANPGARHHLIWWVREGHGGLLCESVLVGRSSIWRVGHGVSDEIGVPKHRLERPFSGQVGQYRFICRYGHGLIEAELSQPDGSVLTLDGVADLETIEIPPGPMRAHCGYKSPDETGKPNEQPSIGSGWGGFMFAYQPV